MKFHLKARRDKAITTGRQEWVLREAVGGPETFTSISDAVNSSTHANRTIEAGGGFCDEEHAFKRGSAAMVEYKPQPAISCGIFVGRGGDRRGELQAGEPVA